MNIFILAELQLHREGQEVTREAILDYAIKIRKWQDKHRGIAEKILAGEIRVYNYKNTKKYGNRLIVDNKYANMVKFARLSVFSGYNTIK